MFIISTPTDLDAARIALFGDSHGSKKKFARLLGFKNSRALAAMHRRKRVPEPVAAHAQTLLMLNSFQLVERKAAICE